MAAWRHYYTVKAIEETVIGWRKEEERKKQTKESSGRVKTETDDGMVLLNSVGALKLIINEWIKSYPPLLLLLIAYPIPCPSHTLARYLHWNPS
jgi:hypothetical protein